MKGFIYKITSPSTDQIYIGSTTLPLQQRLCLHTSKTKHNINNCNSKNIIALGNAVIECLEEIEYGDDVDTLRQREGEYIRQYWNKCVNRIMVGRTQKEYYEEHQQEILNYQKQYYADNKAYINERNKKYYEENKEHIQEYERNRWDTHKIEYNASRREKIACVNCNRMISKSNMPRHLRDSCKSI